MVRRLRSWLVPAVRWLAPSAVAACAGAIAAGIVDGRGIAGVVGMAATTGYLALIAIPGLLIASAVVRGLIAAWRPRELADRLGTHRVAGWIGAVWLGALLVGWAMWQGVWLLASWTAFKPLATSFAIPLLAIVVALLALAASRPLATLCTAVVRRIDIRWRRSGHRTLLRPRTVIAVMIVATAGLLFLIWRFVARPNLGPLDVSPVYAPAIAIVACLIAHVRMPRALAAALVALAAGAIAVALTTRFTSPSQTLEIWGDRPLAGLAIDLVFDLDAIREDIPFTEFRPVERAGAAHPDIVLVTIDTVRADHTPPYGGSADMPVLRELARRGVTFQWAFSPSNVTRRSIPSMVIGLAPHRIRGRVIGWALRVDPRHVLLAERLRAGGYETAGFMCCKGFWSREVRTGLSRGLEHLEIEKDGAKLAKLASTWLAARERAHPDQPLFLWMHILEPHDWATGSGQIRSETDRRRLYDHALARSDAMIGEVVRAFSNRTPDRAPIVFVTADHGEGLGEHGHPAHSTDLYNSQIRVPLVIAGPGITPRNVPETVSLTDVVPTLIELAGFTAPNDPSIDGHSFADLALGKRTGSPDAGIAFAAMIKDRSNPGGITAIVRGRWKLIETDAGLELYDLRVDPDEHTNVAASQPVVVRDLRVLLEAREAAAKKSPF